MWKWFSNNLQEVVWKPKIVKSAYGKGITAVWDATTGLMVCMAHVAYNEIGWPAVSCAALGLASLRICPSLTGLTSVLMNERFPPDDTPPGNDSPYLAAQQHDPKFFRPVFVVVGANSTAQQIGSLRWGWPEEAALGDEILRRSWIQEAVSRCPDFFFFWQSRNLFILATRFHKFQPFPHYNFL
jgi:hypothetical protein